jgi:hypothetical protein
MTELDGEVGKCCAIALGDEARAGFTTDVGMKAAVPAGAISQSDELGTRSGGGSRCRRARS